MTMKTKFISILLLLVSALGTSRIIAQSDKISAKSVVKITTSFVTTEKGKTVKKIGNASGWCYKDPMHVVTDLHVVAGIPDKDIKVYTNQEKVSCGATVEKVLKEADLALLRLDRDIGLIPLELQQADPNSIREYSIWGFPHGIFEIAGDDIRFSRSLTSTPTLNSIISGNDLKFTLEKQGYPWPKAQILRISSTIQPGHSGAPIFTPEGKVVGVADGGLREGTARLNWAMPAYNYVPRLLTSNDPKPSTRSMQVNLYSSTTTVAADATEEEQIREMQQEASNDVIVNGNTSIHKTWSASYEEIFTTMSDDDRKEVLDFVRTYNINMDDTWYDVYEDFETGATISVPAGEDLTVMNGYFYVRNYDNTLEMLTMPYNYDSFESAQSYIAILLNEFMKNGNWASSPDSPDEYKRDVEMETASLEAVRFSTDESGKAFVYHAQVGGPDLLVVMLLMDGNKISDPVYLKQVAHYGVAAQFATFAIK